MDDGNLLNWRPLWISVTTLEDSPMNGVTSGDLGVPKAVENASTMPQDGLLSDDVIKTVSGLLPRERRAIGLTVAGCSSAESAQMIGVSEQAFKLHVTSICSKLGVANQFELILFALHYQLVDANETFSSDDGQCPLLR